MRLTKNNHLTRNRHAFAAASCSIGTLLAGLIVSLLSGALRGFSLQNAPDFAPSNAVFAFVWTLLYLSEGFSLYLLLQKRAFVPEFYAAKRASLALWWLQMFLNFGWLFAFFFGKLYVFSFVWLCALAAVNLSLVILAFRVSPASALLLIPYEGWLIFTAAINLSVALTTP